MAVPEQISAHSAIDTDGFVLHGQLYVPASGVQSSRALYGVDETSDSAGNHFAALAVADHLPITPAGAHIFYATGTTGTQWLSATPLPGAGVLQVLQGFAVSCQLGSAAQQLGFTLSGINEPQMSWWLEVSTTQTATLFIAFARPIPASAAATQIILKTTFPAASTARVDVSLWGYNRAQ